MSLPNISSSISSGSTVSDVGGNLSSMGLSVAPTEASDMKHSNASDMSVATLQAHFEKSLAVNSTLKKNNDIIRKRYHLLKQKNAELQKQSNEATSQAALALQSKEAVERDCEALYKQWNDHVKQQQDEFAVLQSQMVPSRELEMLRIQMAEELEFPHRQKVEALNAEINKFREAYHNEHRLLELHKINLEQIVAEHKNSSERLSAQASKTVSALSEKNAQLQEIVEDSNTVEELRDAQRNNADLLFRQKQLTKENKALREARDDALIELDAVQVQHVKALKAAEGERLVVEQNQKAVTTLYEDIQLDLQSVTTQRSELAEKVIVLEQVKLSFADKMDSKQREIEFVQEATDKRVAEMKLECERKLTQLANALTESQKLLTAATREKNDVTSKLKYADRERDILLKQAKEEQNSKLRALKKKLEDSEQASHDYKLASEEETKNLQATMASVASENSLLKQDIQELEGTIVGHHSTLSDHKESLHRTRAEHEVKATELDSLAQEYSALQTKYRAAMQKTNAATVQNDKLTAEKLQLTRTVEAMEHEIEAERRTHLTVLSEKGQQLDAERDELRGHLTKLKENQGGIVGADTALKLKKDKNKYKAMSLKLRAKTEEYTVQLTAQKTELAQTNVTVTDLKAKLLRATKQLEQAQHENLRLSRAEHKRQAPNSTSSLNSSEYAANLRSRMA